MAERLAGAILGGETSTLEQLTSVFFPAFSETAARTLSALLTRHSYPLGSGRRAFRAPGHPLQARRAATWMLSAWNATRDYPQKLEWFAVHAGLLSSWQSHALGLLFAQALDDGDDTVFQVLRDTASTQHETARMGRHVPLALLASRRSEAWDLAEGLLVAAQRQEGLRQIILETVDEANLDAFVRFLHLILKEDLLRFATCLRAADVWFGLNYDVGDVKTVRKLLAQALGYLEDPASAHVAVQSGTAVDAYLALFTLAMRDAQQASELARPLLADAEAERRMAAAQFLLAAGLLPQTELAPLLEDPDVRISALVVGHVNAWSTQTSALSFQALEAYAARLPRDEQHVPLVFPWWGQTPARSDVTDALTAFVGDQHISVLTPHLSQMSSNGKYRVAALLKEKLPQVLDAASRHLVLALLQDSQSAVSEQALKVVAELDLTPEEADVVCTLLKRRSADLRRGLIRLLARDPERGQLSAAKLLATRNAGQRQAGLQLLLEVGGELPADFQPRGTTEETLVAQITDPGSTLTLADGLGLFDPQQLVPVPDLHAREGEYAQDARRGASLLQHLDGYVHTHRERPLTGAGWDGQETLLLGNAQPWQLRGDPPPLMELWEQWWTRRTDARPGDLIRMHWALGHQIALKEQQTADDDLGDEDFGEDLGDNTPEPEVPVAPEVVEAEVTLARLRAQTIERVLGPRVPFDLRYRGVVSMIVGFLGKNADAVDAELALGAWETGLTYVPRDAQVVTHPQYTWRREDPRDLVAWLARPMNNTGWFPEHLQRVWTLQVYQDRAFANLPRSRPDLTLLLHAQEQGWASQHDLFDTLIGPRASGGGHPELQTYTSRTLREDLPVTPLWLEAVNQVCERVLEVESVRGDLETPATNAALNLRSVAGARWTLPLLASLGKNPLRRGSSGTSRDGTFSHLIRMSFPAPEDTPAAFSKGVEDLKVSDARLLDLAMFAPQWSALVQAKLKWKGLQDGVYWLHAHTRDNSWSVPPEVREAWEAEISERTPLGTDSLTEGAVDVAWFRKMYKSLGAASFTALLSAAKYASSSGGHKRAELFAQTLLGHISEAALRTRITEKRNGDAVRALGLLPFSRKKAVAAAELESRYRLLSDFRREAKQFGAQRQASERLAADIGMHNLARTAGYLDPQRLMWAMEARLAPDWQKAVESGGVTLTVDLSAAGEASLRVIRGEKTLKALPPALKKDPGVVAIRAAVTELQATRKRMRSALEEAMVRGDHFQPQELRDLARHPVISPMLRSLVWVLNEGPVGWWQGDSLQTVGGDEQIGEQALRLAHPHDLFVSGHWITFQERVIFEGLVQPFKQVFREYYPITPAESDAYRSTRYAGHHVQPTQAAGLFKTRGWVTVYEEGVRKTYHAEGINVWVDTPVGYGTPNEVEGSPLSAVYFVRRDEQEAMLLSAVPPRLFSETMRDLDLVVSVAHVGGVDPEASQSTVEMRADLLRETLRLLKLTNVRIDNSHALIQGHYASYTVHLGSGTVHRLPGGFLCVIPVHNQHQGRIFLPFADPDPRTSEVVSKVLLLAEDKKIQDLTILEQLT